MADDRCPVIEQTAPVRIAVRGDSLDAVLVPGSPPTPPLCLCRAAVDGSSSGAIVEKQARQLMEMVSQFEDLFRRNAPDHFIGRDVDHLNHQISL